MAASQISSFSQLDKVNAITNTSNTIFFIEYLLIVQCSVFNAQFYDTGYCIRSPPIIFLVPVKLHFPHDVFAETYQQDALELLYIFDPSVLDHVLV